jgi:hypothetical protein
MPSRLVVKLGANVVYDARRAWPGRPAQQGLGLGRALLLAVRADELRVVPRITLNLDLSLWLWPVRQSSVGCAAP